MAVHCFSLCIKASSLICPMCWNNVSLYRQEMASTLAQKHLRSIILNVSIESEMKV